MKKLLMCVFIKEDEIIFNEGRFNQHSPYDLLVPTICYVFITREDLIRIHHMTY